MAAFVSTGLSAWVGNKQFTNYLNACAINSGAEMLDVTTFGSSGVRTRTAGLKTVQLQMEGYHDSDIEGRNFVEFGNSTTLPVAVVPGNTAVEADTAFIFNAEQASLQWGGSLGEMAKFSLEAESQNHSELVKGQVLVNETINATGSSAGFEGGSVAAGQKLYMSLHVTAFTATTLDVVVESDDTGSFLSPTTRGTFTQATSATAEWLTPVDGPITDTYWRVSYTLTGGGGALTAAFIGIQ